MQACAGQYRLLSVLGEGGMGSVYRAVDPSGREIALKRLVVKEAKLREHYRALFQREYHTLAQLDHPSVIDVYDYGIDDGGPFYTMELLPGTDLRGQAPLPHAQVCALMHDVASSLSLLHARRLVHRDVTARNVRVVAADHAKLMDFGALTPMGSCKDVIGTPAYIAPEAVMMQELDGRADLYSLGVLLYYAVSGRVPYAARRIGELRATWMVTPPPLHQLVPEVPLALSQLCSSLLSFDRNARPRHAGEVMERLSTIGKLQRGPSAASSRAYLSAPTLVGRAEPLTRARRRLLGIFSQKQSGGGLMFCGPQGIGRSRMLDAAVLEAKIMGATVLRASARGSSTVAAFGVLQTLAQQLVLAHPEHFRRAVQTHGQRLRSLLSGASNRGGVELGDLASSAESRNAILGAARLLFRQVSEHATLVLAVDDVHAIDEASLAALATLLADPPPRLLLFSTTLATDDKQALSLQLLRERSELCELSALGARAFDALVESIFGSVPNARTLSHRLYELCRGNPREGMALAQHLIESGVISYQDGSWVLPPELPDGALPRDLAETLRQRLQGLSEPALVLAQLQACSARERLTLDELGHLSFDGSERELYSALDELVASEVLDVVGGDYLFTHDGWPAAVRAGMDDEQLRDRHRALHRLHARAGSDALLVAHHAMLGAEEMAALEIVEEFARGWDREGLELFGMTRLDAEQLGTLFWAVHGTSERTGRGMKLMSRLNYFVLSIGVFVDAKWFTVLAPRVESQLRHESGQMLWQGLDPKLDPMQRVLQALQLAQVQYDNTPEDQRCYPPGDAIKHLVQYAVAAVAVGVRLADRELLRSLPALLEPFAPLAPIVDTIYRDCVATRAFSFGDYEEMRRLYIEVLERLDDPAAAALEHADEIRDAVHWGLAYAEVKMGMPSALGWLAPIADNPRHASTGRSLRAVLAAQRGDWNAALELKRQAEQSDIESDQAQMFNSVHLFVELEVHALGLDLGVVKQLLAPIGALAARYPGWRPLQHYAQGEYERLRGNPETALAAFRRCMEYGQPTHPEDPPREPWYAAAAGEIETLMELGRLRDAKAAADAALGPALGPPSGVRYHLVRRAAALVDAKLGDTEGAQAEVDALLEESLRIGCQGLRLGMLYEARALIAAVRGDADGLSRALGLAREQYLGSSESGLSARYHRLSEAVGRGGTVAHTQGGAALSGNHAQSAASATQALVEETLRLCSDAKTRAQRGLSLLASRCSAQRGFLFLIQPRGLALSASLEEGEEVPPGLRAFVSQLLETELRAYEQPTMTAMLTAAVPPAADLVPASFDHDGQRLYPLWVRARLGGESSAIGIAMLGQGAGGELPARVNEIAGALGTYLLRAGDALVDSQCSAMS